MLQCNEVTRLHASEAVRGASLRTRIAVRIHLLMCRYCRRYVRELRGLGGAVRTLHRDAVDRDHDHEAMVRRVLPQEPGSHE